MSRWSVLIVVCFASVVFGQNKPAPQPAPRLAPLPGPSTPLHLPSTRASEPVIVYTVRPENTIFPSLVICTATVDMQRGMPQTEQQLGEPGGYLGIGVQCSTAGTPVSLTISCDELMEPSTYKGTLAKAGMTYVVFPKIKWKFRELVKCRQQMPANITFKTKIGTREEVEHVETCSVRTINECPLAFIHESGRPISMHFVAAAYVNEDHPWVDGLLKDALATGVVSDFTGYQRHKADAVLQQVYAIWRVLKARGISYSDISVATVKDEKVLSQTIRFLDECIANKQANCVDGTVMIASVLRKIGINTGIVCIPGHAFLAIDLDPAGGDTIGLETTIIGSARKDSFDRLGTLRATMAKQPGYDEASWGNFEAAVKLGTQRLNAELPKLTGKEPASLDYRIISIAEARDLGVRPIPYGSLIGPTPGPNQKSAPRELQRIR